MGNSQRIDFALVPPPPLIAGRMIFAVVNGTERHGELIAHFECESSRLGIGNMMRVSGGATADDAWLLSNKAQLFFRANWLSNGEG